MSHQTGITGNEELVKLFATSKDGSQRLLKISIIGEKLVCVTKCPPKGTWEEDYDAMVLPLLEDKLGAYILYRLDSMSSSGHEWLLIAWTPDFAPIREKMLYAATRATLKSEFGSSQITDDLVGTVEEDVNLAGYKKHLASALAPKPLTMAEEELKMVKENEVNAHISTKSKSQTMQGVVFPLSPDAQDAVMSFRGCQFNYLQLSLNLEKEIIELVSSDTIGVKQLMSRVPTESARYHLFRYEHTHEGDSTISIVFIYSMPGYSCSIKERMLYSSGKAPLCDQLTFNEIEIAKKIEVDDPSELTEEYIYDEIHPKKNIARQAFAKPKGPTGRGPKRMMRPENSQ